jgi:hypothetical protein
MERTPRYSRTTGLCIAKVLALVSEGNAGAAGQLETALPQGQSESARNGLTIELMRQANWYRPVRLPVSLRGDSNG